MEKIGQYGFSLFCCISLRYGYLILNIISDSLQGQDLSIFVNIFEIYLVRQSLRGIKRVLCSYCSCDVPLKCRSTSLSEWNDLASSLDQFTKFSQKTWKSIFTGFSLRDQPDAAIAWKHQYLILIFSCSKYMAWIAEQMMPVHMHVEKVKNIPFKIINTDQQRHKQVFSSANYGYQKVVFTNRASFLSRLECHQIFLSPYPVRGIWLSN